MNPTRRLVVLAAAVALGAGAIALLAVRQIEIPGHRGAKRLVSGFVPGRWDARFLVARGPAAIELPAVPLQATLRLSGPARIQARSDGASVESVLEAAPVPMTFDLPRGGRITLEGQGAVRLHGLRLTRTAGPSVAFAACVLRAGWDRGRGVLVLGVLVAGLLAAAIAGGRVPRAGVGWRVPALAAAVVLVSCLVQVLSTPQPLIIGDPGAYYDMSARFRDAWRSPPGLGEALYDLRPYAGLAFTATLYALLRLIRDEPSTLYVAQSLAMGGAVFFFVRAAARAFGARAAIATGGLAVSYATFPIICGIVQPEPFILLLWSFAFDRTVAVGQGAPARSLVPAGLAFGVGLALHPQGLWYLLAAAVLLLLPFVVLLRRPLVRRGLSFFALGLLPVAVATAVGERWARPAVHVLDDRYGFFAYTSPYPLGFWLFLETDGWQAGQRLDETRYAREFLTLQEQGEIRGGTEAWAFTLRFVARHSKESLRAVLRNLYRLYARPDNPFHRTWILPYGLQVAWHRALIVGLLLSVPLLLRSASGPALLPVGMLAATYPLYHIFNKYALPATPFILVGAGVLVARLMTVRPRLVSTALGVAALGAWVPPAALVFNGLPAPAARWGLLVALLGGLAAAFLYWLRGEATTWSARFLGGLGAVALLLALAGHAWDDPSWRAFTVGAHEAPRQEIAFGAEDVARLRAARESYLAVSLQLDDGDPSDLRLEFDGGLVVDGAALEPAMPPFGLATFRGGRDPRAFPQWWLLRWQPAMLTAGRMGLTLRGDAGSRLAGDVGADPPRSHHGLSLGDRPYLSVYRLMHDGEYRLPVHQATEISDRRALRKGTPFAGTYGVRLVILDDDAGGAAWQSAPAPAGHVVVAVWARAGRQARAEMTTPSGVLPFELGGTGPWRGTGGELRYAATGEYEGWYLLRTSNPRPGPVTVSVRPRQEMLSVPKYFLPEARPAPPVPPDWSSLPLAGLKTIGEASEAPPWRVLAVY